jgi:hypothetical protein
VRRHHPQRLTHLRHHISVMDASRGVLETIFLWNDSTRSFYFAVQQLSVLGWG